MFNDGKGRNDDKNHPFSVGKGSIHMHVRYFFIADKMDKIEVRIVCYPAEKMVSDYSSNPLQGKIFVIHRNTIQGASEKDFQLHKRWCKEVLDKHDLLDKMKVDLNDM